MRYVFITGTSRGLGEALLNEFKKDRIISISRSEVDSDVQLFKAFHLDLKNESELEKESPKIFSSIAPAEGDEIFLINNAGSVGPVQSVENMDAAGYLDSYKVNVLAPALLIKAFINKYKNHPKVESGDCILPVLSNQKSNVFLKEIAILCGIRKKLTTHLARHTFATTVTLSNGVPIESVSKMLGHKDLRTTQHYAKIVDRKIARI